MPASFTLKKHADDSFYFEFLDKNGTCVLTSGRYPDKEMAKQAIKEVRVGSLMANQIAAGKAAGGELFFVIKDTADNILAESVLFTDRMRFDNALHNTKDSACIAEIIEQN